MPLSTKTTADTLLQQTAELEKLLNPINDSSAKIYDFSGKQGTRARQKLAEKIQTIETALNNIQETDPSKLSKLRNNLVRINWELSNIQNNISKKNKQIQSNQQLSTFQKIKLCCHERSLRVFTQKQEADLPRFKDETTLKKLYDRAVALRFESRELKDFIIEKNDDAKKATSHIKTHVGEWFAEKSSSRDVLVIKIERSHRDEPESIEVRVLDDGFSYKGTVYNSLKDLLKELQATQHISQSTKQELDNLAQPTPNISAAETLFNSGKFSTQNLFSIIPTQDSNAFILVTKNNKTLTQRPITINTLGEVTIEGNKYKNFNEAKKALSLSDTVSQAKEALNKRQNLLTPGVKQFDTTQGQALETRKAAALKLMTLNQPYYLICGNTTPIENSTSITVYTLTKTKPWIGIGNESISEKKEEFTITNNGIGNCTTWQAFEKAHLTDKLPFSDLETLFQTFKQESAPYHKESKKDALTYLEQARHVIPADKRAVTVYEENGELWLAYQSPKNEIATIEKLSMEEFKNNLTKLQAEDPDKVTADMKKREGIIQNIRDLSGFSPETKNKVEETLANYHKFLPAEADKKFTLCIDKGEVYICYLKNNKVHTQPIDLSKLSIDMRGEILLKELLPNTFDDTYKLSIDLHAKYTQIRDMQSKLENIITANTSDHPGKIYPAKDKAQANRDFQDVVNLARAVKSEETVKSKKPDAYVMWETEQSGIYEASLLKDGKVHTCKIDLVKNRGKLSVTIDGTENTYDDPEVLKTLGFTRAAHTYKDDIASYNILNSKLKKDISAVSALKENISERDALGFARQAAVYQIRADIIHFVRIGNAEQAGTLLQNLNSLLSALSSAWNWATGTQANFTPSVYVLSMLVKQPDNSYKLEDHQFTLNPVTGKILLNNFEYENFNAVLKTFTNGKSNIPLNELTSNIHNIKKMEQLLQHQAAQLTAPKKEIDAALVNHSFIAVYESSRQESTVSVNSQDLPIEKTEYSLAYYDTAKKTIVRKKIDLYTTPGKVGVDGEFFDSLQAAVNASCGNRRYLTDGDIEVQKPAPQQSVFASVDVAKPQPRNATIQTVQPASQQVSSATAAFKAQYTKLKRKKDRIKFAENITGSDTDRAAIYKAILPLSIFIPAIKYNLDGTTPEARWNEIKGKVAEFDVANLTQKDAQDLLLGMLGYEEGVTWEKATKDKSEFSSRVKDLNIDDSDFATLKENPGIRSAFKL